MQSISYENYHQTGQGDYMTGMTKLAGLIRLLDSNEYRHWIRICCREILFLLGPLTMDPLTLDPLSLDPLLLDPLSSEPLSFDPLLLDLSALDPLTLDPLTLDPLTLDPLTLDPLILDPFSLDPLALDPLATRLTSQVFPPDRIREGWCEICQTYKIANLQFQSVSP